MRFSLGIWSRDANGCVCAASNWVRSSIASWMIWDAGSIIWARGWTRLDADRRSSRLPYARLFCVIFYVECLCSHATRLLFVCHMVSLSLSFCAISICCCCCSLSFTRILLLFPLSCYFVALSSLLLFCCSFLFLLLFCCSFFSLLLVFSAISLFFLFY